MSNQHHIYSQVKTVLYDMGNRFGEAIEQKEGEGGSQAAQEAAQAATGQDEVETKRLNVRVPKPLYDAFKSKAESEGRTMTWVVLQAIRNYIGE